ncbi:hypothetical protein IMZ48_17345 [Candidatus Bathyarchaeota archaeon]|nr:hypothetical protein [Candidatus Bathyarchaeota archaeon]
MSGAAGLADFKDREFIAVIGDEASSTPPPHQQPTVAALLTHRRTPSRAFSSPA